ncbi:MAG: hypothetical protein QXD84_09220, partial [Thermoplasmata archaeon]
LISRVESRNNFLSANIRALTPYQYMRKLTRRKLRWLIRENIKMVARYAPAYLLEEGFTVERGSGT